MSENAQPSQTLPIASVSDRNVEVNTRSDQASSKDGTRRLTRVDNRCRSVDGSIPKDFEGNIPKL